MSLQEESQLLSDEDDDMSLISLQEKSEMIRQAVMANDIDTLTEMITSGVDLNYVVVRDEDGVSGIYQ